MKIGINLLYLLQEMVGGTVTLAACLLHGLRQITAPHEFTVFVNRESTDWALSTASNFTCVACPISAVNRRNRYFFKQIRFPKLLRDSKID